MGDLFVKLTSEQLKEIDKSAGCIVALDGCHYETREVFVRAAAGNEGQGNKNYHEYIESQVEEIKKILIKNYSK
jgi:hypothetical protein